MNISPALQIQCSRCSRCLLKVPAQGAWHLEPTVKAEYTFILGAEVEGTQLGLTLAGGEIQVTVCADGSYTVDKLKGFANTLIGQVPMQTQQAAPGRITCPR